MRAHKVRRGAKVIRSGQMLKRAFEDAKHVADAELFGKGAAVEKSDEVKPVCITLAILFNDGTTKKYVSIADDFEPEDDDEDFDECCDDDGCMDDEEAGSCSECPCYGECHSWEDESDEGDDGDGDDDDDEAESEDDADADDYAEIDRLMKRLNELAGRRLARAKAKHHAGK